MSDMSWMLHPKAIRQAKTCISIIKEITGDKLKLSDSEFLQRVHGYLDDTASSELGEAYARLISMAGVGFGANNLTSRNAHARQTIFKRAAEDSVACLVAPGATVEFSGKIYPRYRSGLEFKGVYRGQPRYS